MCTCTALSCMEGHISGLAGRKRQQEARLLTGTGACAGNRRKKQNIVKKSVGFNWGPSAGRRLGG